MEYKKFLKSISIHFKCSFMQLKQQTSGHNNIPSLGVIYITYWISATKDTVLVQGNTKALVCASTSITVLPCEEEAKTSHDVVVPLIRELVTIVVEKTIIRNIEHLQHHLY